MGNNRKILIAEDDRMLSNAYRLKLESAGFEVHIVYEGDAVISAIEQYSPDLVILDLMMPKKNGIEVLKEIRESEKFNDIPVIVASNIGQEDAISKCVDLGVEEYIVKSDYSIGSLSDRVNHILSNKSYD